MPHLTEPPVQSSQSLALRAFCAPFVVFMVFLMLVELLQSLGRPEFPFAQPQYWVYPLQTVVCGALVWHYRRHYRLHWPKQWAFTLAIAILVLGLWISPQELLGFPRRYDGFNPTVFTSGSPLYWGTLLFRFMRLVIVVPLLEEIFWRAFLLRYLIREDFEAIPLGKFSRTSFTGVAICFALAHWGPDFWPALLTGALYNLVMIRTRSLGSCVLAHAVTNLILGLYIMKTGQWGFW